MAITAWPFETDDTTEVQFSKLLDALQETGVVEGSAITAGAAMTVNIAVGKWLIKGFFVESTAIENRAVGAAPGTVGHTRKDALIVKVNLSTNAATLEVKAGTANGTGGILPVLQQDSAIWEHLIAELPIPQGTTSMAGANINERLVGLSRAWLLYRNNNERPTPTRISFGLNTTSGKMEWYNGAAWASLQVAWADVTGKPATFAPVIGAGAGDAVAGNDARLTDSRTPIAHDINGALHTGILTIANGGTGAITAAAARTALEALGGVVQASALPDPTTGNYVGRLLIEY